MIGTFPGPAPAAASRFASTVDQTVDADRHLGVRATVALLVADQPEVARKVLLRSVQRQARLSGCGRGIDLAGAAS